MDSFEVVDDMFDKMLDEKKFRRIKSRREAICIAYAFDYPKLLSKFLYGLSGDYISLENTIYKSEPGDKEYIQRKIKNKIENLIPDNEYSWIRSDEKASMFVWISILEWRKLGFQNPIYATNISNEFKDVKSGDVIEKETPLVINDGIFKVLTDNINVSVTDHNSRIRAIEFLFDISDSFHGDKTITLSLMKNIFSRMEARDYFSWLSLKDTGMIKWLSEYLLSNEVMDKNFITTAKKDKFYAIFAFVYFFAAKNHHNDRDDSTTVFMSKLNKSRYQKTFRDSKKGMKAVNIFLPESSKEKLDWLCDELNRSMSEVIEKMIESEVIRKRQRR